MNIGNKLYLKITNKCNLQCPFCYSPNKNKTFDINALGTYIEKYNITDLIFHGGEPLLESNNILKIIDKFPLSYHLVTNLTLDINSEIEIILKKCELSTSYSIDRFNANTFENWIKNIEYLHNEKLNFTLIVTLSEKQLQQKEKDLKNIIEMVNPTFVSFERCHGNYDEEFYKKSDDYLCNISKIIDKNKNATFLKFKKCIENSVPCVDYKCEHTYTIDYRNKIYKCPSLCEESIIEKNIKECMYCEYYPYCKGDCPSFRKVCSFPKHFFDWVNKCKL